MKHSFVQKMLILTALLFLFVMAKPAAAFADGSDEAGNAEPTGVEEIGEHYGSRVTEQREKTVVSPSVSGSPIRVIPSTMFSLIADKP